MKASNKKKLLSVTTIFMLATAMTMTMFTTTVPVTKAEVLPTPKIEVWGEQTIDTWVGGGSGGYFPGLLRTANGTLVCFIKVGNGETNRDVYYRLSHDNGTTWSERHTLYLDASGDGEVQVNYLGADGVAYHVQANTPHHVGTTSHKIYASYDNGTTWSWVKSESGSWGSHRIWFTHNWNGIIYGMILDPGLDHAVRIIKSDDNGTSWTLHSTVRASGANEWDAIPIYGNMSWRTMHRDDHGWEDTNLISYNDGASWTEYTDGDLPHKQNRCPNFWWLDKEVLIASVETYESHPAKGSYFYTSIDNGTSWQNETQLGSEGTGNAYTVGTPLASDVFGRSGLGGVGYVVWTEDSNTYLKGAWIANNDTMPAWDLPAGYGNNFTYYAQLSESEEDGETYSDVQWLSINDQSNESLLFNSWRNYSGRLYNDQEQIQINVTNDSIYNSFINITDINEANYPTQYMQNETRWWFYDPNTIQSYGGEHGAHYYRYRVKYRTVTPE
jgi:hypothetical protein